MLERIDGVRPTDSEIKSMWKTIQFSPRELQDPEFAEFKNILNVYFPTHIFKCFFIEENHCFDYFVSRREFLALDFIRMFLSNPHFLQHVPELMMDKVDHKLFSYFNTVDTFCLDGEIASLLFHGDVYGNSPFQHGKDAKNFGLKLVDRIMGHRYSEFIVFQSEKRWCPWLNGLFVHTFIMMDCRSRLIYVFCINCWD